ncbi:MAG: glycosyltransferase family 39 protein [candidate division WWE3 bacterium]|nr:glycosyltransferase family 39 protein [candidate division WWE3 bacterium]
MKSLSKKQELFLTLIVFVIAVAIGFYLRYVAASTLPMINDEGSYLFDAYLLGQGHLPFLTSFSRAPVFMIPLALWLKIFGVSILSGRLFAVLVSLGSSVVLYFLGKELKGKALGVVAFVIFATISPVAIHGSYVLTENLEIFLGLLGSLFLIYSLRTRPWFLSIASGVCFGLAIATRETAAVYPLFLCIAILVLRFSKQTLLRLALCGLATFGVWAVMWGGIASQVGLGHVVKNFQAILKMHSTGVKVSTGFVIREKLGEIWYLKIDYLIFYLSTIAFAILAVTKKWWRNKQIWFLLAIAGGPILFYGVYYQRIQPEYFASFMPGFTLMMAYVVVAIYEWLKTRSASVVTSVGIAGVIIFGITNLLTFTYQLKNNRTGTFYLQPMANVVAWFQVNTQPTDEIFTAAVGIPMFSGRHLALNISRPVIYGYPHIKSDIKYALFPTPQAIMDYLTVNQTKYYIVEKATRDSFYNGHSELKQFLESNFKHLKTFPNPTNPIEVWIRNP